MSDNSKKYLWIAVAMTAFVLVVAAAALLLFKPSPVSDETPFDVKGTAEAKQTQTTDYSAQTPSGETTAQTTEGGKSGDVYIVYGDKGQTTTTVVTTQAAPPAQPKPTPTTLSVAPATTTTVKAEPAAQAPAVKSVQSKPASAPESAAAAPAKMASKAQAKPQASSGDYWIQTGSFSKQASASSNRDYLSAQHFPAEIKSIGGNYKVRVGPYATRAEAANMLSSVKLLKGCEAAWITQ
jgi:cell division protein FtsN